MNSASTWTPYLDNFLRAQNLPSRGAASASTSASFQVLLPPQLNENGRNEFQQYISHAPHKAFAVAPDGAFGWRSRQPTVADASREALEAWARYSGHYSLYAVDDALAR